ncbi:MAG: hypothetical protein KF768_04355 [Phycisphaeraceae bacterium]|nr:hypothetical protein [Phycisphaeraceae bacterium]
MNLTPRQKLAVAVLGLAVVALGVDQMIGNPLPGPESALGSDDTLLIPRSGAVTADAARVAARARVLTVRQQLETLRSSTPAESAEVSSFPDAFGLSPQLRSRVAPPQVAVAEDGKVQLVRGPDRPNLRSDLKLTSILSFRDASADAGADAEAVAVIDGRTCRVGDTFSGWIVREITPKSVLLEEPGDWAEHGGPRQLRLNLRDRAEPGGRS